MATFIEMSRIVTGFPDIGGNLEGVYSAVMLSNSEWEAELCALSLAVDAEVASNDPDAALKAIMDRQPPVAAAARRLAHLWYTGRLPAENGTDGQFVSE